MANLMVGRELADLYPPRDARRAAGRAGPAGARLHRAGLGRRTSSFEVRPGEILGFAGLVGAGRTELFEGLLGLRPASGDVEIWPASRCSCAIRATPRSHGLTYLSEDRKGKGLHVHFGLRQNLTLMALERYAKPWLQPDAERAALAEAVKDYGIRTGDLDARASSLSGGNQQKLALAKVLQPQPQGRGARRAHARRRRRRQARHLFPDPATGPRRAGRDRRLVRADGADRPVPPRRGDARRPHRQPRWTPTT